MGGLDFAHNTAGLSPAGYPPRSRLLASLVHDHFQNRGSFSRRRTLTGGIAGRDPEEDLRAGQGDRGGGGEQWLRGLRDPVAKRAVYNRISRVRVGNFGDCEPVGSGVHELRIPVGKGYRVYFTQRGGRFRC